MPYMICGEHLPRHGSCIRLQFTHRQPTACLPRLPGDCKQDLSAVLKVHQHIQPVSIRAIYPFCKSDSFGATMA